MTNATNPMPAEHCTASRSLSVGSAIGASRGQKNHAAALTATALAKPTAIHQYVISLSFATVLVAKSSFIFVAHSTSGAVSSGYIGTIGVDWYFVYPFLEELRQNTA
jgi:hypothetical protein